MQRPAENLPLQVAGRAGEGTVVVSITEYPKDYVVWSVANLCFGNPLCLGLLAFYFSVKSRDRKIEGDLSGARSYGSTACCINRVAVSLVLSLLITVIVLVTKVMSFSEFRFLKIKL
ncbi:interferon-induced transmembrane protein 3-like [Salminus brasiliensis]|uniref:interferon-induced transmembrane protein 3-like n=1 Tax=Salminus brasiliensis TaxID=930266 RepID=UPI003B82DDA6